MREESYCGMTKNEAKIAVAGAISFVGGLIGMMTNENNTTRRIVCAGFAYAGLAAIVVPALRAGCRITKQAAETMANMAPYHREHTDLFFTLYSPDQPNADDEQELAATRRALPEDVSQQVNRMVR